MSPTPTTRVEPDVPPERVGLDPEDWEPLRALGHALLDDMIEYLKTVRDRPAWRSPPAPTREYLSAPVPRAGTDASIVYDAIKQHVLPYPTGNIHPRFWGWVMGTGTPVGLLADLVASTMNCNVPGCDQAAALMEHQVIRWIAELMDFPADASGLLVDGCTAANLIGLAVARNRERDRTDGRAPAARGALTVYGSTATHSWLDRACDLLGLGVDAFRKVPVDARHRVLVDELAARIRADRERGMRPFCIVGNAGTVACGATDDLRALGDLAAREGLWFHVDGAFGALAKLSPKYRHLVDGLERADSVALDLHKWGYLQYELGVVLVRDAAAHAQAFSFTTSYFENLRGGIAIGSNELASRGLQLSRGNRALRVWMPLSVYGTDRIGRLVEQNIEDVAYLRARVGREPELENLGPCEMNLACFRYVAADASPTGLDELNKELLVRLQESGTAVPTHVRIDGRFAIRVANTNHRTTRADFDVLVDAVLRIGRELEAESTRGLEVARATMPSQRKPG